MRNKKQKNEESSKQGVEKSENDGGVVLKKRK